jgi:trk system potassium uptake protein TrkA
VPAARETDMFADGAVQIVEFDVPADGAAAAITGRPLRAAGLPPESTVASIVRDGRAVEPTGGESILAGDRLIVIASPAAAQTWSRIMAPDDRDVDEVVIFGGGRVGLAVARALLERGIRVRLLEPDAARAQRCASELPRARVFHAGGLDPDFMRQERIGRAAAAVSAMRDDAKNLYAAILARAHGVPFTIGVVDNPVSAMVFERGGVDVAVNPRTETAEEMIRFAHDPRTRQLAMLDDDRFEVIDIVVRAESRLAGMRFRDMPRTGSVIGALIRDGVAVFPRGDEVLRAGDRAIVLVDSTRASIVERAL